jgi:hypothetical protein
MSILRQRIPTCSAPKIRQRARGALRICRSRLKIVCHGTILKVYFHFKDGRRIEAYKNIRVEKYRPDTLDDVSGHQDILATINRFVETNVRLLFLSVNKKTSQ